MGNTSSNQSNCKSCNTCSQNGLYFSFGRSQKSDKLFAVIKGKERRVYVDSKGKFYKDGSVRKILPKGTRTYKEKKNKKQQQKRKSNPKKVPKKKVPKGYYLRKQIKSPLLKQVKDKKKRKIGSRLSARAVFNEMGMRAVGRSFPILQKDGTTKMKVLRIRQNGSPYFANNFGNNKVTKLNLLDIPVNKNWLRGSSLDNMTGLKQSYPMNLIPPGGVAQPRKMSILPKVNNFGS